MAKIKVQDTEITLLQWEEQINICIKTIIVLASIVINNLSVFAQTKDFEHHTLLAGDTLKCSAAEASGYNDFHGCKISNIYNIVDTCCFETGDEKNTSAYHLAILSPDYLDGGGGWNLYSDRILLIRKGDDTFIYDNVISNEIYDACERFFIPSEDKDDETFNRPCDFELEFGGGQGYNIGIRILDDKLYVVGLKIWEHNSSFTYTKNIAFEYDEREFPLEMFERSMIDTVRNDRNPLYELYD